MATTTWGSYMEFLSEQHEGDMEFLLHEIPYGLPTDLVG
jgi:hypothetical protein